MGTQGRLGEKIIACGRQEWLHTPIISALGRLRQRGEHQIQGQSRLHSKTVFKKKREEEGNGSGGRGKKDKRKRNHRKGVIVNLILEAPRRYSLA